MGIFVYILLVTGTVAIASGHRCCLPGEVLTKNQQCKDLQTLKTSPVSLSCPNRMVADRDTTEFFMNDLGQLEFPLPNRIVTYTNYCQDKLAIGDRRKQVAIICSEPPPVIQEHVYGYCMVVSAFFLILTVIRYMLEDLRRDLFGKSVVNLCTSLACGLAILAVMKLMSYTDMNWCAVRGFGVYYFVLVSFFWMNAIALQTLNSIRPHNTAEEREAVEKKWYPMCVVYAWGMPALLTFLTALVNFLPGDHLKPGIGLNHCWFFNVSQQWEYMYSVMSVLSAVNIVIFALATSRVCCTRDASAYGELKQKFLKCVQLFVVMGIPWIFEMVSSLAPRHLAWEIIDLLNALQGLWIFIVLVVLRTASNDQSEQNTQYINNIISSEPPYLKLEK